MKPTVSESSTFRLLGSVIPRIKHASMNNVDGEQRDVNAKDGTRTASSPGGTRPITIRHKGVQEASGQRGAYIFNKEERPGIFLCVEE